MEEYIKFKKIYLYVKKSVNIKLKAETLIAKQNLINNLYDVINTKINENTTSVAENQLDTILENVAKWHLEATRILKIKLNKLGHKTKHTAVSSFPKLNKNPGGNMATEAKFDIKLANALVHPYDGSAENLEFFLDTASLLKDYVEPTQVASAIKFLKTRLTGKARVGLRNDYATIDEILSDIRLKCTDTTSPESIIAQMKTLRMKPNQDAKEYCDSVEKCCTKLKSIYINQQIPTEVAEAMSRKAGIDALITGISNTDIKLILKAGTFTSLAQAITKISEYSQQETQGSQILSFTRQGGQAIRGNFRRGTGRGFRPNFNSRNFNQNQNSYNHQRYNNTYRPRGNFQRNYQGQGNSFRGRRGNNRQVFSIQSGNPQPGIEQIQQLMPNMVISPGNQQPHVVYPQATAQIAQPNFQQPNFFGQVQRGWQTSSL